MRKNCRMNVKNLDKWSQKPLFLASHMGGQLASGKISSRDQKFGNNIHKPVFGSTFPADTRSNVLFHPENMILVPPILIQVLASSQLTNKLINVSSINQTLAISSFR